MVAKFTLRPIGYTDNFVRGDHAYQYEVEGLPPGEQASIAEMPMGKHCWQILRTRDGIRGDWTRECKSVEDALAALQEEFQT